MNNNYLLFFFLLPLFSQAQFFKELNGKVFHEEYSVVGVHVINTTSGATTITDKEGGFSIGVKLQDTIVFSAIQYQKKILVVTKQSLDQEQVMVALEKKVTELNEVVLKPHNLTGNPLEDMNNSGVKPAINFDDVGIPGYKGKREEKIVSTLQAFNYGIPLGAINIEALYKNWSGYYAGLKKRRKWDAENETVVNIIVFYGVQFFMNEYQLQQEEVYPFVLGCVADTNIERDFKNGNHNLLLNIFAERAKQNENKN